MATKPERLTDERIAEMIAHCEEPVVQSDRFRDDTLRAFAELRERRARDADLLALIERYISTEDCQGIDACIALEECRKHDDLSDAVRCRSAWCEHFGLTEVPDAKAE